MTEVRYIYVYETEIFKTILQLWSLVQFNSIIPPFDRIKNFTVNEIDFRES